MIAHSKARQIILGNIAGSIQLLGTLLAYKNMIDRNIEMGSANNNNVYSNINMELIMSLKLYKQVKKYLTQQSSIYHYKIALPPRPPPLPTPLSAHTHPIQPSYISSITIQPSLLNLSEPDQLSISINVIQVVASYLNF